MPKKKKKPARYVIGMDLGGTKILAAVVTKQGRIQGEAKAKTRPEEGPDAIIKRMAAVARQAARNAQVDWSAVQGMGVGAPGPLNPETGVVHHAPNLPGWEEVPLASRLSKALGIPVFVENDVNLGTLGEYLLGAGQGTQDMVGIFVGTGVGGGLILGGKLRSGYRHAAAEVGHMIVLAGGPRCGCGKQGCLEALASRTAIERDIRAALTAGRESLISEIGKSGEPLTSGVLAQAFRQGDPLVTEVVGQAQWYMGLLTASIVNLIDPEMVVFGGGMVEAMGEEFLTPIRHAARQHFIQQADADQVQIVAARLGGYAGVLGAAMLAWQRSR